MRLGRRCLDFLDSPVDLRGLGDLHDGPVARGARLASVSREQMRQDGVQALMFLAIEFGILDERYIPRSSNLPHLADHTHSFVLQGLEFVAHIFVVAVGDFTTMMTRNNGTFVPRCGFRVE